MTHDENENSRSDLHSDKNRKGNMGAYDDTDTQSNINISIDSNSDKNSGDERNNIHDEMVSGGNVRYVRYLQLHYPKTKETHSRLQCNSSLKSQLEQV